MSAQTFKILVTGPFAAGKTSMIQSVSQTQVVVTSGEESDVKSHTPVAMDFGISCLDGDDTRLLLFETPGQARFRFMTSILKGGVELRALLRDPRVPAVIAVNRCNDITVARRLARSLGALDRKAVVPCQLVDTDSGREVVVEILLTLLASMESTKAEVA